MPESTRRRAPSRLGKALGWGAFSAFVILGAILGAVIGIDGGGARVSASDPPAGSVPLRDDFEVLAGWDAAPADGVEMSLAQGDGYRGRGLRLAFDFHGHGGYAIARRRVALDLPANYELTFRLRGEAPPENLEVKLLDPSGENVWWSVRRDFAFPREWRRITVKKRHLAFAWGPAGGGEIHRISGLEIVVSAGSTGGGRGAVEIDDLELRTLPPEHPYTRRPAVAASSAAPGSAADRALDGDPAAGWHSLPPAGSAAGDPQWLALDFLESREYGGLAIDWDADDFATRYEVETSDDGERWETVRTAVRSHGRRAYVPLPETESRHVRLRLLASSRGRGYGIRELAVRPLEWAASPNAFFTSLSKEAPRGAYPRSITGEQAYWTLVGVDGGADQGLLDEDGRLEAGRRGFSVEPFVYADGALTGWSDVTASVALAGGYLPIPQVRWERAGLALETTAFASGPAATPTLYARYRLANRGARPRRARLFLALRPFQVNPPWQFLGPPGGVTEIRKIAFDGRNVRVDGGPAPRTVVSLTPPSAFGASVSDDGPITEPLGRGELPPSPAADDPSGWASGALAYDFALAPGATGEVDLAIPLGPEAAASAPAIPRDGKQAAAFVEAELARVAAGWHARIDLTGRSGLRLILPPAARPLIDTLRTALADVLVSRDGPALRPGTRSYARSWIRDGALISEALLRLGSSAEARDFLAWYAPYQYPDGKVPCCVDARGADPVPENDSHGELIYLLASYYRYTHDRELVGRLWEHAERAVAYIDTLRRQRRTPEYQAPDQLAYYGLLPQSISHEGYSAKPAYSYWDDFFALRGLEDAAFLARALGKDALARRYVADADEFRRDLEASVRRSIASHGIDYIPGAAELGDFDATSTTIALAPGGEQARLPQPELRRTFERYWENFVRRRAAWSEHPPAGDDAYTPYELRAVGAFVRLGWRDRAHELLAAFLADRRPLAWNQWPEVVWRDPRAPKFLGDLPHAWVGAEFIRSALDLFAYDRESDGALVVGAGIPLAWAASGEGVSVENLPTPYGRLAYAVRTRGKTTEIRLRGEGWTMPPRGIAVHWPFEGRPSRATVNGKPVAIPQGDELIVRALPAEVVLWDP